MSTAVNNFLMYAYIKSFNFAGGIRMNSWLAHHIKKQVSVLALGLATTRTKP